MLRAGGCMLIETKERLRRVTLPLSRALVSAGVAPDWLTAAGLVAAACTGFALALGEVPLSLAFLLVSLLCDLLDGDVARLRARGPSAFGAFLDSTADRISEAFLFAGLLIGKSAHGGGLHPLWILAWVLALTSAFLVSYTRARAEGLGLSCRIGIADRSVRMVLVVAMLVAGLRASGYFLGVLSLLGWITVGQRIGHVRRQAVYAGCRSPEIPSGAPASASARDRDALAVPRK
jgi:CDP-diacylglycerol--glycerol-3-phosphate 3-phosphatidyltransferase